MPSDNNDRSIDPGTPRPLSSRSACSRLTARSNTSYRSRVSARSARSVYSIRSVNHSGGTPDVFVTQPTNRGRRTFAVHRGRSVSRKPFKTDADGRRVRYYHPSVTAVIPNIAKQTDSSSEETLRVPSANTDSASMVSVPRTADMVKDFPGAVNVKKIAQESAVDFEHAKAAVDGLRPSVKSWHLSQGEYPLDIYLKTRQFSADVAANDKNTEAEHNHTRTLSTREIQPYSTVGDKFAIQKHRHNALLSLCGEADAEAGASYDNIPATLTPRGEKSLRKSSHSGSFVLPANSATFFDDSEARKSYVSASSSYVSPTGGPVQSNRSRDTLQYLAYSPALSLDSRELSKKKASADWTTSTSRVDSAYASNLRHLYERIERLEDSLEEGDGSLLRSMQQATRVHSMVLDAAKETFTRPSERARIVDIPVQSSVRKRESVLDNGFPILSHSVDTFSADPSYTKRVMTRDELKLLQKEERRKAALENPEKKRRQHNRSSRKLRKRTRSEDMPLLQRMLAKLAF